MLAASLRYFFCKISGILYCNIVANFFSVNFSKFPLPWESCFVPPRLRTHVTYKHRPSHPQLYRYLGLVIVINLLWNSEPAWTNAQLWYHHDMYLFYFRREQTFFTEKDSAQILQRAPHRISHVMTRECLRWSVLQLWKSRQRYALLLMVTQCSAERLRDKR